MAQLRAVKRRIGEMGFTVILLLGLGAGLATYPPPPAAAGRTAPGPAAAGRASGRSTAAPGDNEADAGASARAPLLAQSIGEVLFTYPTLDVTTPPLDVALGVEYALGYYWLTGRSRQDNVKKLLKLDTQARFVAEYVQDSCDQSSFGYRDLAFDGAYLWAGDECGVDKIDPANGQRVGGFDNPDGQLVRGLAYDPSTHYFYAANFRNPIYVFNTSGTVIRSMPNPASISIFGLAWDDLSSGGPYLWAWWGSCNDCVNINATRLDPGTAAFTGVGFSGVPVSNGTVQEVPGGATISDEVGQQVALITVHQITDQSDVIRGYSLGFASSQWTPSPTTTPPTATRTRTRTATVTRTPSSTRTATPTRTPTLSLTPSATPSGTVTATPTETAPAPTNTPTAVSSTATATATATASGTRIPPSATPSAIPFSDVPTDSYFYQPVQYLAAQGAISGYSDPAHCPAGAPCFLPYHNTTRSQMVKIVVLAAGIDLEHPAVPTFSDVPSDNAFFSFVETAVAKGVVGGYDGAGQCAPAAPPCFKPYNDVTRGQLAKIVVGAMGWPLADPPTATFSDVAVGSTFFRQVETAAAHHAIGGYQVEGRLEFRPYNPAIRAQIAKIIFLALANGRR